MIADYLIRFAEEVGGFYCSRTEEQEEWEEKAEEQKKRKEIKLSQDYEQMSAFSAFSAGLVTKLLKPLVLILGGK